MFCKAESLQCGDVVFLGVPFVFGELIEKRFSKKHYRLKFFMCPEYHLIREVFYLDCLLLISGPYLDRLKQINNLSRWN